MIWLFVSEHLAKIAHIDGLTARRAVKEMLGLVLNFRPDDFAGRDCWQALAS